MIRILMLSMMLVILLAGCSRNVRRAECPTFPKPSESVQAKLDRLARTDPEVAEWGNKLLNHCQKLGDCKRDGGAGNGFRASELHSKRFPPNNYFLLLTLGY